MRTTLLTFLTALGLLLSTSVMAQVKTVTGTVTDADTKETLPGVNVVVKGTTIGAITDASGGYSIKVSEGQVLQFTFIGYLAQEITVGSSSQINVLLKTDVKSLEEIVVVGYGTQKKGNLTGAVSTVDAGKTLEARPIADVGRGLQGTVPGLTVVVPSGEIGSDPLMKIRGQIASFQGTALPLILVDNVEVPSLQMLNPNDIATISVLKDAASASIYGSKAAFGVILITTKSGSGVKGVNVEYTTNISFQNISKKMEMGRLDAMEYTLLAFERVGGSVPPGAFWKVTREGYERAQQWQTTWGNVVKPNDPMVYGRDWYVDANGYKIGLRTYDPYDYMIREWAPTQNHNLSISGQEGHLDYNISLGYLYQQGINKPAKHDDFTKYNTSVHLGADITKKLKVHSNILYSQRNKRYAYVTSSTTADPWLYLYRWASTYPMTTEDGDPVRSPAYEMKAANTANQQYNYISLTGGFVYTPMKDWTINLDYTHANQEYFTDRPGTRFTARDSWSAALPKNDSNGNRIYVNNAGEVVPSTADGAMPAYQLNMTTYTAAGSNPDHYYRNSENDVWNTLNLYSTYEMSIAADHKLKYMVGINRVGYQYEYNWSQVTQLVDYNNPQFNLAYGTQTAGGNAYWESQLGFYGRINYSFKDKYLLEGNLRYDGTSKFPTDLQWRWYPSFSAGWRVNEEPWMRWSDPVLSSLKLRGSWGMIGDQTVSNSLYMPTMSGSQSTWIASGARTYQFSTPGAVSANVTWQDIINIDLGFDARLLNNALGITFDWFQRDTKNMIVPQEGLPPTFGTSAPQVNTGSLSTKGFEVQVDYSHRFQNGLGFTVTATLSDAVSKITKYGSTKSIDSWYVGKTYGEIWGYQTDRLYQKEDFQYSGTTLVTGTSSDGYTINLLSDPEAATQGRLQAGQFKFGPGDVKFVDRNNDGIINPGNRLIKGADGKPDYGDLKVIGNSTPRYTYGFRVDLDYKGFDLSVFVQGVGKREVWGDGFLAIPGYNSSDGAIPEAFASNFWKEDRTTAFYPRPYNMAGSNNTLNFVPQTRYLLNMSYLRFKNITAGYTLPTTLTDKIDVNKVRVYVALENFFTIDHLGTLPIDPEEIEGYSMWNSSNYNMSRTGVGVPTFKSASVGIQVNF